MTNLTTEPAITPALIEQHGLSPGEFDRIKGILGREPNYTELGVFSVMWSEHCSYKSSRLHLKKLPTRSDRVLVGPFTWIAASRIEDDAQAGPYARLRPGAHVEPGAHVGNFVELKKTRLGAGSKAMHLAYLGDSDIGRNVNIGAGTITCNYDGAKKHPTTIGDGAFVGSNSTLVAPVEIGAGAYLAAGSVITKTVPPDALGLGRARQENKEGWARKRRKTNHG